jgi:hypothetical protein
VNYQERNKWYQSHPTHHPNPSYSTNLAGRYPSIIQTRHGKASAMEEQAKLFADLTATISSMNSKLEEMHPVVLDLSSWRPMIERNMDNLHAEVGDLRTRMSEVVRSTSSSPTGAASSLHGGRATAPTDTA